MTVWWRDHQISNLFTPPIDEQPTVLTVAMDVNVLMDLHTRSHLPTAVRSQALLSPDLEGRMELVVPFGLEQDLRARSSDGRARLVSAAGQYRRPDCDPIRARSLFDTLHASARSTLPAFGTRDTDDGDIWQIVYAAAAGVKVLVTWDERMRDSLGPVVAGVDRPEFAEFRIVDPDHLIIHLDELAHAAAYHPRALEGSEFQIGLAGATSEPTLMAFRDTRTGETKSQLRTRVRELARNSYNVEVVSDADGAPMACLATHRDADLLRVPLLRVADHVHAETIARRLLWLLRERARDAHTSVVLIDDPHISPVLGRTSVYESYEQLGDRLLAWVIDVCGPSLQISTTASAARESLGLAPSALLPPRLTAEIAAQYERAWWPAKIIDSSLSHFAVAIQPSWSAGLFGVPQTLTERPHQLAIGRQQVYYRSGQKSVLKAPGRILWYLSQDRNVRRSRSHGAPAASAFIGTSMLDAIETDTPEALHAALQHYGVFTLNNIREAANQRGLAQALRISDTEIFRYPVSRREYDKIRQVHAGPEMILSPTSISPAMFAEIYNRGTSHTQTTPAHEH